MVTIRTLTTLAMMLTAVTAATPAAACPAGYVACGAACCPGK